MIITIRDCFEYLPDPPKARCGFVFIFITNLIFFFLGIKLQFNYNFFRRKHTNSADPTFHLLDLDKAGQKFCLFIE